MAYAMLHLFHTPRTMAVLPCMSLDMPNILPAIAPMSSSSLREKSTVRCGRDAVHRHFSGLKWLRMCWLLGIQETRRKRVVGWTTFDSRDGTVSLSRRSIAPAFHRSLQ